MRHAVAAKGRLAYTDNKVAVYFCETYCVYLPANGVGLFVLQAVESAGVCDMDALISALKRMSYLHRWIRKGMGGMRMQEIVAMLIEKGALLTADGNTAEEALSNLIDESGFIPMIREGTDDLDVVKSDPFYFKALLNPSCLTESSKRILSMINDFYNIRRVGQGAENPVCHCNVSDILSSKPLKDITRKQIYLNLIELISKHCIVLTDRYPKVPDGEPDLTGDVPCFNTIV